jgi:hypothetical protein
MVFAQDSGNILYGALLGALYGTVFRWGANVPGFQVLISVMMFSLIGLVPFAMGYIAVFFAERDRPQPIWIWISLPWISVIAASLVSLAFFWEGLICVAMFIPIGLVFGSLGGLAAGAVSRRRRLKNPAFAAVLLLPLLWAPVEKHHPASYEGRTVENTILIRASPQIIWSNIERVRAIQTPELPSSWSRRIGFPAPVEATLSQQTLGGVRHATFAGGVLFIETVDTWEPQHKLGFSISAQTRQIPNTTLDPHVTIGGPYFDVLHGEYELQPLPTGDVLLHLRSRHRLSTNFNWYAHFWTDGIMSDIQRSILVVIKHRCEVQASLKARL